MKRVSNTALILNEPCRKKRRRTNIHNGTWKENMRQLQSNTALCDVTFCVKIASPSENELLSIDHADHDSNNAYCIQEFHCHKVLFIAHSKYFESLFKNDKQSDNTKIQLCGITPEIFQVIKNHCYGVYPNITTVNVFVCALLTNTLWIH